MGLEVATFISQLVPANPAGLDDYSTADDHLRLIKSVLQSQFPNFTAVAMNATVAELNTLDGYTGNVSDFNILSGAAVAGLTATELLFLNGVTSAIQTQLDGKAPTAHTHGTAEIDNNAVTLAKLADIATDSFLGRDTIGTGDPEVLSATVARTILNVENGATADQTAAEIEAIVNHDNLLGFVANEHLDWTADLGATNLHANNSANGALALTSAEVTQLANIGATVIAASNWTALAALAGTNTGDEGVASETVQGIVERATQAEVDAGTDTTRYVSPATLANKPGSAPGIIKHKTADESVANSIVVQDDDHLVNYILDAATYYKIEGYLKVSSISSTPDFRAVFAVDNAFQEGFASYHMTNGAGLNATEADVLTNEITLAVVANVPGGLIIHGFILTHATLATNLDFRWAQSVSDAAAVSVERGSWLAFEKIA